MTTKIGLVLEGGGFRGLYTAGVLHCFAENQIELPYIIGVSMGASNATNYLAKQSKRNLEVPYTFVNDPRYISYKRLFTKGELFDMRFIFNDIAEQHIPFDVATFAAAQQQLIYVTTDCETGQPYYIPKRSNAEAFKALEASTSLPFAAKMVKLHDKLLLDGGVSDPIPINKALVDGCDKLVVILTQPQHYQKAPFKAKLLAKLKYQRYPHLVKAILQRHHLYNGQLAQLQQLEAAGKALVIRPFAKLPISRTEKNKDKLKQAFELGFAQGNQELSRLRTFLGES